jgi:hypothetical protein
MIGQEQQEKNSEKQGLYRKYYSKEGKILKCTQRTREREKNIRKGTKTNRRIQTGTIDEEIGSETKAMQGKGKAQKQKKFKTGTNTRLITGTSTETMSGKWCGIAQTWCGIAQYDAA